MLSGTVFHQSGWHLWDEDLFTLVRADRMFLGDIKVVGKNPCVFITLKMVGLGVFFETKIWIW